jgi:hypothetical protein
MHNFAASFELKSTKANLFDKPFASIITFIFKFNKNEKLTIVLRIKLFTGLTFF